MFRYYFTLGLRSLRRNRALTALMILTLAVGVAASVSTVTILHAMSGDPLPHKSDRLFVPLIDILPVKGYVPGEKPGFSQVQMSYIDAQNFMRSKNGRAPHRDVWRGRPGRTGAQGYRFLLRPGHGAHARLLHHVRTTFFAWPAMERSR